MAFTNPTRAEITEMLRGVRTIAVVGLSPDPARPSHDVARAMQAAGFTIVPVRPGGGRILGEPVVPDLDSLPGPVDLVDVFRRHDKGSPNDASGVVEQRSGEMRYLTKKQLSRRTLLKSAGASIALPLLESMIPAGVANTATAATPRSRLACIYIPHGAVMSRWTPATDGAGFTFPPTLKSLEPFRDRLNVISDLTLPLAYGQDASAGANHTRSSAVWITCAKPETGASPRLGTSMDQVAAQYVGQETPLPSLEVSSETTVQVAAGIRAAVDDIRRALPAGVQRVTATVAGSTVRICST